MTSTGSPLRAHEVSYSQSASQRVNFSRLLGQIIFLGALLLIVLSAIPYGSVEFWWTSFFELGVFALVILWALQALLASSYRRERWVWLFLPAAALVAFSLLQAIPFGPGFSAGLAESIKYSISADPFESRSFAFRLAAVALLGVLLLRFTETRQQLRVLILTVLGVAAASAVFGILRQSLQLNETGFVLPALSRGIGYAQIISRNQFAFTMEIALGLALGLVFRRGGRFESSLIYLALALPVAAALILANSRGGIFTMMCQLLFLAVLVAPPAIGRSPRQTDQGGARGRSLPLRIATSMLLIGALLLVATMSVIWVGGERVVTNLSTVTEELKPEEDQARWNTRRIDIWRATWQMIKDHPVAGVGFGGYWTAIPKYHDASGAYTPQQAHNDYLEILASGGVIGCAIVVWFGILFFQRTRKVLSQAGSFRRAACLGALVGLFGVAVHSLFDFGLHLTINSALCAALIAIATVDTQDDVEKNAAVQ
jgi:putative inorganic carbon (HCO3(-)) transporter